MFYLPTSLGTSLTPSEIGLYCIICTISQSPFPKEQANTGGPFSQHTHIFSFLKYYSSRFTHRASPPNPPPKTTIYILSLLTKTTDDDDDDDDEKQVCLFFPLYTHYYRAKLDNAHTQPQNYLKYFQLLLPPIHLTLFPTPPRRPPFYAQQQPQRKKPT